MNPSPEATDLKPVAENKIAPASPKRTVRELLGSGEFRAQLNAALPKHITPDRMVRVVLTAGMKNPKLFACTQESLFLAVLNCAAVGLEPDGRRAHLIPFENKKKGTVECQLIYGYAGLCELVYRSGLVSTIHADVVCDKDDFEVDAGQLKTHIVNYREDRGDAYAAYCIVRFKDGTHIIEVMARNEIERIRDNSQGWRAFRAGYSKSSPWADSPGEMWKKTACRRVVKWCPQSPELQRAIEDDTAEVLDIDAIVKAPPQVSMRDALGEGKEAAYVAEPIVSADTPDEPTPEEKDAAEAQRAKLRESLIGALRERCLAGSTDEKKLFKAAKAAGIVPDGIDEVWNLSTEALAKLADLK